MSLLAVGISHQTAPVSLLEQVSMSGDETVKTLHELVDSDHVTEAIVLATCNRVEVFAGFQYWHNKFGNVETATFKGTEEKSFLAGVAFHVF